MELYRTYTTVENIYTLHVYEFYSMYRLNFVKKPRCKKIFVSTLNLHLYIYIYIYISIYI